MVPDESSAEFENRLRSRGIELSRLAPDVAFAEVFEFYRDVRPIGCVPHEHDGDMLLYQWGTYDWGNGMYFSLDLTRQFVLEKTTTPSFIWRLASSTRLRPHSMALNEGHRWCHSPADLPTIVEVGRMWPHRGGARRR
jgi:hypothetical protein